MKHEVILTTEWDEVFGLVSEAVDRVRDCSLVRRPLADPLAAPWPAAAPPVAWIIHLDRPGRAEQLLRFLMARTAREQQVPVLAIGEVDAPTLARDLMMAGAVEYFPRPLDQGRLALALDLATLSLRMHRRAGIEPVPRAVDGWDIGGPEPFLAGGPREAGLQRQLESVARVRSTVLITGETGTGKTRLARGLHYLSPWRDQPLVVVNCGSLVPSLIESELFGHRKGSFTGATEHREGKFATARAGTLLLDEIDSLPLDLQAKLLRVVDERVFEPIGAHRSQPVEARIVVATNRDLATEVREGRFRQDLYYRVNVVTFDLPPLRERREAIRPLVERFLWMFAKQNGVTAPVVEEDAWQLLEEHDWPGNARELRNVVERVTSLSDAARWTVDTLRATVPHLFVVRDKLMRGDVLESASPPEAAPPKFRDLKHAAEVRILRETLSRHYNNRTRAARELGISRVALYKKLHRHGLV